MVSRDTVSRDTVNMNLMHKVTLQKPDLSPCRVHTGQRRVRWDECPGPSVTCDHVSCRCFFLIISKQT